MSSGSSIRQSTSMSSKSTTKYESFLKTIRLFRLELFTFIFTFAASVEDVTIQLLAQDKICMKRLNSSRICAQLSEIDPRWPSSEILLKIKDEILVQVTMFNFYQTLIYTVPLLFTSLFLSSWADRHRKSAKILLSIASLMFSIESIFVLLNVYFFHWDVHLILLSFLFFPMVGGLQVVSMTVMSYVTITTSSKNRIKRFIILELIAIISNPLGIFVGGQLIRSDLKVTKWAKHNGQLHNYHFVILLGLTCKLIAFIYALLAKFKKRKKKIKRNDDYDDEFEYNNLKRTESDPLLLELDNTIKKKKKKKKNKTPVYRVKKYARSVTDIFVLKNITESFEVCIKRRKDQLHVFIWFMLIAMTIFTMTQLSLSTILFQFVQKLYYWNAETYSTYNSVLHVTTQLSGLLIVTPALTEIFHLSDSSLLMIGLLSQLAQNFIRGTIIDVYAFCASYLFGSVTSLVSISIRSKLSKLIDQEEQYRLFGMLTMMETISPILGISMFTLIFNQTITWYAGFVYQFSCFILMLPLTIAVYINSFLPVDFDCQMNCLHIDNNGNGSNNNELKIEICTDVNKSIINKSKQNLHPHHHHQHYLRRKQIIDEIEDTEDGELTEEC